MYICIVSVYVDDINIIGKRHDIIEARHHLTEFEMKDLGETKLCLGLQLEIFFIWDICIARCLYTENIGYLFDPHNSRSQTDFIFLMVELLFLGNIPSRLVGDSHKGPLNNQGKPA
jgi:hypothetical protein